MYGVRTHPLVILYHTIEVWGTGSDDVGSTQSTTAPDTFFNQSGAASQGQQRSNTILPNSLKFRGQFRGERRDAAPVCLVPDRTREAESWRSEGMVLGQITAPTR